MKKSDLQNRMVVELENGERYMVVGDRLMAKNSYILLDNFDDDLTFIESEDVGIQRVYEKVAVFSQVDMGGVLRVLWKRQWEPSYGEDYYIADPTYVELYDVFAWKDNPADRNWLEKGLAFKTKEEAIELAEKMLQLAKGDKQ